VTIILTSHSRSSYGTVDIRGGSTMRSAHPATVLRGEFQGSPSGSMSTHRPPTPSSTAVLPRTSERQRGALHAEPPSALFRRLALRDPLQSAGGVDCCVHREFLLPPRLRRRRRLRPRAPDASSRLAGMQGPARVDDGEVVSVDAVPPGKGIEAAGGGLLRRQQGPGDAVRVE
jgi:hypothetical protein